MKANYHTHTHFCNHAKGTTLDYAQKAIEHGFTHLGISDHAPNDEVPDYHVRMKMDKFKDYIKDIEYAQKMTKGQLTIFKGVEVEYWDNHEEYYEFLESNVAYMIHGQHYVLKTNDIKQLTSSFSLRTVDELHLYAEFMIKAIKSKRFVFHAHPDLYMCGYKKWDQHSQAVAHKILKVAKEEDAVFEFNANGYRRGSVETAIGKQPLYPRQEFWDLVKTYNIKTILSSDCHEPKLLYDNSMKKVEEVYLNQMFNDVGLLDL